MKDMTQGNPVKEVLLFSIPMILASVFQQMYNAVDSIIVGQFVGANALAAVGAAFPAMFLAMSVLIGITMGVQIIISQLFGAGEHERMRATFATSMISLIIMVAIASVIGHFASGSILGLMNTPPEIIADSEAYLDEIFKGLIFMFLYNLYTSVLRGVGDSKTPLYFLIISSILNIVLDLVYVVQFGLGVRGVAIATVQSQAVSAVLCIIYTNIRIPLFRLGLRDLRVDFDILKTILRFGIPTAIQQSISAVGSMLVQGLVNSFGATAAAAFAAGNKVESFMMMPLINIANATSTYVAQNTGAGKLDRVRDGFQEGDADQCADHPGHQCDSAVYPGVADADLYQHRGDRCDRIRLSVSFHPVLLLLPAGTDVQYVRFLPGCRRYECGAGHIDDRTVCAHRFGLCPGQAAGLPHHQYLAAHRLGVLAHTGLPGIPFRSLDPVRHYSP